MSNNNLLKIESTLKDHSFPKQIVIETTAFCNQRCSHCGHKTMKRKKGNMEIKLYKKIIDEISQVDPSTEVWMTFYGEALLLRYKLYYMIKYAKDKGLTNVVLNSNAGLLDDENADLLIESGLDRFIISIDGFSKETYEKIRVGGTFEQTYQNVLGMWNKIKSKGLRKPKLEVQFSVMDENESEVEDFNEYWLNQGVYVKNREKLTWAGTVKASNLSNDLSRIACPWTICTCAIHWNGDIVACAVDYDGGYIAGNVNDNSIQHIWQNGHKNLRDIHLNHQFEDLPKVCINCLDWQAVGAFTLDPVTRKKIVKNK